MSDFNYNLRPDTAIPLESGTAIIAATHISISPISNTGLDLTNFLFGWADDAARKVPFDLEFTVDGGTPITVEVTAVSNEVEESGNYQPRVRFAVTDASTLIPATSGVLSAELGLKVKQKDRPCGGYELFDIDDDDPTCTNSCVFRNVVSGREFQFSNLRKGKYEIYFEGPNEKYEIIWATPSGDCNPDKIGVLNRVQGKTLFLEDYGNSPNSGDINFGDLIITATNGSYEWAGGDSDPVFYTTVNNGTLCGPGEICSGGQCVTDTSTAGSLDLDDVLLVHAGPEKDELYSVRAGDYMSRYNSTNQFPISRGSETFSSGLLEFDDFEETDSVAVYRPSDSTVYKISGQQYTDEFFYPTGPAATINSAALRYKTSGSTGLDGQTFQLEINAPDQKGVEYKVISRIIGARINDTIDNTKANIFLRTPPGQFIDDYLDSDRTGTVGIHFMGDRALREDVLWTQEGGASIEITNSYGIALGGWQTFGWEENDNSSKGLLRVKINGTPDFQKPFVLDLVGRGHQKYSPTIISHNMPASYSGARGTVNFDGYENINIFRIGEKTRIDYAENTFSSGYCQWTIEGVSVADRTVDLFYGNPCTVVPDPLNDENKQKWYARNLRILNEEESYISEGTEFTGHHYIDISNTANNFDTVSEIATFSNIGGKTLYEWTMASSVDMLGSSFSAFYKDAVMRLDVVASRNGRDSNFVSTNYLRIL